MSPGATWKPFTISQQEYEALTAALMSTSLSEIQPHARYAHVAMKLDPVFDHIRDRFAWMKAVCIKHRDAWHEELRKTGAER